MIVLATDAPLDSRGLGRLAKRAVFGLARTGTPPIVNSSARPMLVCTSAPTV